jgi:hypothetical protein
MAHDSILENEKDSSNGKKKGRIANIQPFGERKVLAAFATFLPITAAPSSAIATANGRTLFAGTRDIDRELAALKLFVVEHLHRFAGFSRGRKLNKGKPARFAREFIHHQINGADDSGFGKKILEVLFRRLVGKITNEQSRLAHSDPCGCAQELGGEILPWQSF